MPPYRMAAAELGLGGLAPPSGRSTASGGGGMAGPRRRRGSPTMQCCRIRQASGSESMGYISSQYGQQGRGKGKPVKCGSAALRPLMRPCMLLLHHGTMTTSPSSRPLTLKSPSTSSTSFGRKGRPGRTGSDAIIGQDLYRDSTERCTAAAALHFAVLHWGPLGLVPEDHVHHLLLETRRRWGHSGVCA